MSESRLLIVDDEQQLVRVLRPSFTAAGYEVDSVASAGEALRAVSEKSFDAVILDLGLPDGDGKQVIAKVRQWSSVPIIVLSARDSEQEKIDALDQGANDFVNKPFAIGELMARVRVALRSRRLAPVAAETRRVAHVDIDFTARRLRVKGRDVRLSPRELKLLRALTDRLDEVLSYNTIVAAVWGPDSDVDSQFVRVLVSNLRQKIELDPTRPQLILTEPGIGYRMRAIAETA